MSILVFFCRLLEQTHSLHCLIDDTHFIGLAVAETGLISVVLNGSFYNSSRQRIYMYNIDP